MYQFIEMKNINIQEAVYLCVQEYMQEQRKSKALPTFHQEMKDMITGMITYLKDTPYGKALTYRGKLIGFLAFFGPYDGFHGVSKGVFSPLGASAFAGEDREKIASLLFSAISEDLIKDKVFSIAISRYANDEDVNKSLCLNSFGIRCSDAILTLEDYMYSDKNNDISVVELNGNNKLMVKELYERLIIHLRKAPCFFPTPSGQSDRWFENTKSRIFAAKYKNKIIGYMAFDEDAETFITERKDMSNICGAYVLEEYRALGVAKQILDTIVRICIDEGKSYLGVDYETINPTALHFWTKYFKPYTYSLIRRIDERI